MRLIKLGPTNVFGPALNSKNRLIYCHYCYYDPLSGRWISRDPAGLDGGVNGYEYCNGNPLMNVDPSGKDFREYLQGVGGVFRGYGSTLKGVVTSPWAMAEFAGMWAGSGWSRDYGIGAASAA